MKIPGAVIPLGIRLQSAAFQLLGWKAQLTLPTMMEDTWRWQSEATSGSHAPFLFGRVAVAVSLLTAWAAFDLRQAVSAASLDPSQQVNKPKWLRELKAGPYRLRDWPLRGQLSELMTSKLSIRVALNRISVPLQVAVTCVRAWRTFYHAHLPCGCMIARPRGNPGF